VKILIKKVSWALFDFFIITSLTVFLLSIFSVVEESINNSVTLVFATCGLCFMIIYIVNKWSDNIMSLFVYVENKIKRNKKC